MDVETKSAGGAGNRTAPDSSAHSAAAGRRRKIGYGRDTDACGMDGLRKKRLGLYCNWKHATPRPGSIALFKSRQSKDAGDRRLRPGVCGRSHILKHPLSTKHRTLL